MSPVSHGASSRAGLPSKPRNIDRPGVEKATRELLEALGVDLSSESFSETPRRMAALYGELLTPEPFSATTFANTGQYDELVIATNMAFHSLCMHHLLPFFGAAHVGYVPGGKLIGVSKLARAVDYYARDLQVQENLTTQIADWLETTLEPIGVAVVLVAEHTCMTIRGAEKRGARMVTSAVRGSLRNEKGIRAEVLALASDRKAALG
jgi:GTP cyclohydrolase IA